jgi:hypothetical protein
MGVADLNYFFSRTFSLGLSVEYRYAPVRIKSFALTGFYLDLDENDQLIDGSARVTVPGHTLNSGGF